MLLVVGLDRANGGLCARCRPLVRVLQRAVLCEVGEDGGGSFDAGDNANYAAAVEAPVHIDVENALETLRPGHRATALHGSARVCAHLRRFRVVGRAFAAPNGFTCE